MLVAVVVTVLTVATLFTAPDEGIKANTQYQSVVTSSGLHSHCRRLNKKATQHLLQHQNLKVLGSRHLRLRATFGPNHYKTACYDSIVTEVWPFKR